MESPTSKRKISLIAIISIAAVLLVIAGIAIYAIASRPAATQNQTQTPSSTDRPVVTPESIQQDVSEMNTSVKNQADDYSATKAAFEDKDKIKVTN